MIISTVKIDVCGNVSTITGTDLERSATVKVECEGGSTWATCVDPRALIAAIDAKGGEVTLTPGEDILVVAKGGEVTLTPGEDTLIVAQGHKTTRLATLPAENFPVPASGAAAATYQTDCPAFLAALNRVAHAIGSEQTRYYSGGVHFDTQESTLKLVATDGHRLAAHDTGLPAQTVKDGGTILPAATVKMLQSALKKERGPLVIEIDKMVFRFSFGGAVIAARAIDASFPDWRRVVPEAAARINTI